MDDKTIFEKIAAGWEWLDQNYDGLDETAKAAFDDMTWGTVALIFKYGCATGKTIRNARVAFIAGAVMTGGVTIAVYKLNEWRKNRPNKTEATGF